MTGKIKKKYTKLSPEIKEELVKEYIGTDCTSVSLGEKYGVSPKTVNNILSLVGIDRRISSTRFSKTYYVDENYFDVIDSEYKAYWLGWLYSDGYNNQSRGTVVISLQERDKTILEKFSSDIKTNKPLQFINMKSVNPASQNQYRLTISSRHMCNQLELLGCVPRKGLVLKFPTENQVSIKLVKPFLKGMWDGDGSIYYSITKENRFQSNCCLTSTRAFCEEVQIYLRKEIKISSKIYWDKQSRITSNLKIAGNQQVRIFLNWLYEDSPIHLERKYSKFQEIMGILKERGLDRMKRKPRKIDKLELCG